METEKLIIAGAGPAGVSAALYAVRSGITPLVLHKGGGALEKAVKIENYYGLPKPVTGAELYQNGLKQLESFQVPVVEEELLAVEYDGDYTVQTADHTYHSKALILATGAKRNTLALKELKKYEGSGISYCAVCDGFFYRGKDVAVLGNGAYALHEAKVLEPLAAKVTILTNGKEESFSKEELGTIQVETKKLISAGGDTSLSYVELEDHSRLSCLVFLLLWAQRTAPTLPESWGWSLKTTISSLNQIPAPRSPDFMLQETAPEACSRLLKPYMKEPWPEPGQ